MQQVATLASLRDEVASGRMPVVEVHGVDPSIYLVFQQVTAHPATRGGNLRGNVGGVSPPEDSHWLVAVVQESSRIKLGEVRPKPLRFPSRHAACQALKATGLATVQFVHRTAYDEMIGLESSASRGEMRELIDLRDINGDVEEA